MRKNLSRKKKAIIGAVLLTLAISFTACSSKEKPTQDTKTAQVTTQVEATTTEATPEVTTEAVPEATTQAPSKKEAKAPKGYKSYNNEELKLSIDYPEDWVMKEDLVGATAAFLTPMELGDDFNANVTIMVQDLPSVLALADYVKITEAQIESLKFELLDGKDSKVGKTEAYEMTYKGVQQERELQFHQKFYIIDKKAYIVTYTSTPEKFEENISQVKEMFKSLKMN